MIQSFIRFHTVSIGFKSGVRGPEDRIDTTSNIVCKSRADLFFLGVFGVDGGEGGRGLRAIRSSKAGKGAFSVDRAINDEVLLNGCKTAFDAHPVRDPCRWRRTNENCSLYHSMHRPTI
jgi:hypothetical protein